MNEVLAYDIIAEMYFRDTGHLHMGKDVPPELMEDFYEDEEAQQKEWAEWRIANNNHVMAVKQFIDEV